MPVERSDGYHITGDPTMNPSILCWNCSGVGNRDFMREVLDLKRNYNPSTIVLLEPKISGWGASDVSRRIGKTHWIRLEADSFSGGVCLLWEEDSIKIGLLNVHKFFIHVAVMVSSGRSWLFTAVYASLKAHIRNHLWLVLDELHRGAPWLLTGDLNCILKGDERSSGIRVFESFVD